MKASPEIPDGSSQMEGSKVVVTVVDSFDVPPLPSVDYEDSTVYGKEEDPHSSSWADLHPELLGLVLNHLPLMTDRVQVRAVCHPWRSNSLGQQILPTFPWIILPDGAFLCVSDGKINRMSVPRDASCQSSIDNWLFLMHNNGSCSLMDPFSRTRLELPDIVSVWRYEPHYRFNPDSLCYKLVVQLPLGSSPVISLMIRDCDIRNTFCVSNQHVGSYSFRDDREPMLHVWDAEFFQGKLYVITLLGKLCLVEFCMDLGGSLNIECLIDSFGGVSKIPEYLPADNLYMSLLYLVECGGRLLSVRRLLRDRSASSSEAMSVLEIFETVGFNILEADLSTNPCQWKKVSDFNGHAVFINQQGSKSLRAGEFTEYKKDCLYFMCDYDCPLPLNPLCDAGVYNIKTCKITPLMSETTEVASHCYGNWRPAWIFPPETV